MTARRTTIYLPIEAELALGAREGDSMSARIATVALRYDLLWRAAAPALTEAEWCAICDALNGVWLTEDTDGAPHAFLWAEIADCEGLGDKWSIDQDALAQRLRSASAPERIAVAEVVRRFWDDPNDVPRAALERAGARLVD